MSRALRYGKTPRIFKEPQDYRFASDDTVLGEYSSESSIVEINFKKQEYQNSLDYIKSLPKIDYSDVFAGRNLTRPVDLTKITPVLTYSHEFNHFSSLFSTPFGLYIWRIQQALAVDLQFLCFLHQLTVMPQPPYRENIVARARLFETEMLPKLASSEALLLLWNDSRSENYANFLCWEIYLFDRYLGALIGGGELTRMAFFRLGEICDFLLQFRSETEIGRVVKPPRNPDRPLVEDGELSPLAIVELMAVTRELAMLLRVGANPASISDWYSRTAHGIYGEALRFAQRHFGLSTGLMTTVGDVALGGPMDIACAAGEVDFDEWYPTDRMQGLVQHLRTAPFTELALVRSPPFARLPDQEYKALLSRPLWGDGFIQSGSRDLSSPDRLIAAVGSGDKSPVSWYDETFRRFFALKGDLKYNEIYNQTDRKLGAPIVLFSDSTDLAKPPESQEEARQLLTVVNLTLSHKFTRAVMSNEKIAGKWVENSLQRHLVPTAGETGPGHETGGEIIRRLFGEEMRQRYT